MDIFRRHPLCVFGVSLLLLAAYFLTTRNDSTGTPLIHAKTHELPSVFAQLALSESQTATIQAAYSDSREALSKIQLAHHSPVGEQIQVLGVLDALDSKIVSALTPEQCQKRDDDIKRVRLAGIEAKIKRLEGTFALTSDQRDRLRAFIEATTPNIPHAYPRTPYQGGMSDYELFRVIAGDFTPPQKEIIAGIEKRKAEATAARRLEQQKLDEAAQERSEDMMLQAAAGP